jgi:PAS domain S-box-containing protein
VLALPLLRLLAIAAGITWVALAPGAHHGVGPVHVVLAAFAVYSGALIAALWHRPGAMLRLNAGVLVADLVFALLLIRATGGATSTLFLALILVAGVQSYYHGLGRGVATAAASAVGYIAVAWTTIVPSEWANIAIRLLMLMGTAVAVGILRRVEDGERRAVLELTAAARDREHFIVNVVESLHEGVVAIDLGGRVVLCNRAFERQQALPPGALLGQSIFETLPNALSGPLAQALRRLLAGDIVEFSLPATERDTPGSGRVVENVSAAVLRRHGEPIGAVMVVDDVTERAALERTTRQSEKLAALGTLSAGIAHELNNPIGIICSRIELMLLDGESNGLTASVNDDLRVLQRQAQRVAHISQGLLSFARQAPLEHGRVDLNALVGETLLLMEGSLGKRRIEVRCRLTPDLPPVWGDVNALQQVLVNLLTNARDAVPDGGVISVETDAAPGRPGAARLIIRDNGPGIPPEVSARIFDPFFTTKAGGTGLGLSVSYGIVRDHKGTLLVESQPGAGATFVATFPVARMGAAA